MSRQRQIAKPFILREGFCKTGSVYVIYVKTSDIVDIYVKTTPNSKTLHPARRICHLVARRLIYVIYVYVKTMPNSKTLHPARRIYHLVARRLILRYLCSGRKIAKPLAVREGFCKWQWAEIPRINKKTKKHRVFSFKAAKWSRKVSKSVLKKMPSAAPFAKSFGLGRRFFFFKHKTEQKHRVLSFKAAIFV